MGVGREGGREEGQAGRGAGVSILQPSLPPGRASCTVIWHPKKCRLGMALTGLCWGIQRSLGQLISVWSWGRGGESMGALPTGRTWSWATQGQDTTLTTFFPTHIFVVLSDLV